MPTKRNYIIKAGSSHPSKGVGSIGIILANFHEKALLVKADVAA